MSFLLRSNSVLCKWIFSSNSNTKNMHVKVLCIFATLHSPFYGNKLTADLTPTNRHPRFGALYVYILFGYSPARKILRFFCTKIVRKHHTTEKRVDSICFEAKIPWSSKIIKIAAFSLIGKCAFCHCARDQQMSLPNYICPRIYYYAATYRAM